MIRFFSRELYRRSLVKGLTGTALCFILSGALSVLVLFFYPKFAQSGIWQRWQEMLRAFPEELLSRFGLNQIPNFSDYQHFLAGWMQILLLIGCFFALYLGTVSLIRYESDRSIVFLYAQPISRISIVLSKLLSQFTLLAVYNLGVFAILCWMSSAYARQTNSFYPALLGVFFIFLLVELLFLSIGLFFSTLLTHSSQCASVAFLLFCSVLLFGLLAKSISALKWLHYLSPYFYFEIYPLLAGGSAPILPVVLSLLISAAAIGGSCWHYRKKDFII